GYADAAQPFINFAHVGDRALAQRLIDHAAQLHASEIGGLQMLADNFLVKLPDLLVLVLDVFNDLVSVPVHFQAELELARHLVQNIFERGVNALEHFADIVIGAKHGAKAHGNDGVIPHHGFDHVLMGQRIFARGIEDVDGGIADHGGNVLVIDGINQFSGAANAAFAERDSLFGLHDAVYVTSAFAGDRRGRGIRRQVYV